MTSDESCTAIKGFMEPIMAKANQPTSSWNVQPVPNGVVVEITVGLPGNRKVMRLTVEEHELDSSSKQEITTFVKENLEGNL